MNQLQTLVTRIFRLEKPIDKRLLWGSLAAIAIILFMVFTSASDGSGDATVATANGSSPNLRSVGPVASNQNAAITSNQAGLVAPKIFVHVVGQVAHPGLYVLPSGSRVADAVLAADGFNRFADQSSVNLARLLSDGEQIVVASRGGSLRSDANISTSAAHTVNLNRASELEIESLPGVGPTLAGRIVDWRLANGGFKTKADLQKVAGIGDKLFAQLKDLVSL